MARPKKTRAEFDKVRRQDPRLAVFMRAHFADLQAELGPGRIDWRVPMAVFARLRLRDEHGQPVSLATASRTWRRIRREMEAKEAARAAAAPPILRPGEVAPGVRPIPQIPSWPGVTAAPVPAPAPASAGASATPGPVAPATLPGAPADQAAAAAGATEQIRAALHRMGARRVPLPPQR